MSYELRNYYELRSEVLAQRRLFYLERRICKNILFYKTKCFSMEFKDKYIKKLLNNIVKQLFYSLFVTCYYFFFLFSKFTAQESISDTRRVFTIPLPCIGIDTRLIIISPIST